MSLEPRWEERVHDAVRQFWATRGNQAQRQGEKTGSRDAGNRTAVTGGKQLDGFVELVREYLIDCKIHESDIYLNQKVELPGWFRAEKQWDLLVVVGGKLIAAMEFKSQVALSEITLITGQKKYWGVRRIFGLHTGKGHSRFLSVPGWVTSCCWKR